MPANYRPIQHAALETWLLLAALLVLPTLHAAEIRVQWVPDGDTVRLSDDRWVRLAGIDAPETGARDGRLVGSVFNGEGRLLNEMLVAEGLATFYPHADDDESLQRRLLQAQHRAMDARAGFWPTILAIPAPPEGWIGNRRSHFGRMTASIT